MDSSAKRINAGMIPCRWMRTGWQQFRAVDQPLLIVVNDPVLTRFVVRDHGMFRCCEML